VSKDSPKQASPLRDEIEAFFDQVASSGVQPRLRGVTGVCEFDLEGAGTWHVSTKNGAVSVAEGAAKTPPADCVLWTTAEDFVRIVHREGNLNLMAAVLQEIVTIKGDLVFAYTLLGSFVFTPSGAPTR
jgi:putative sterol carrier protein